MTQDRPDLDRIRQEMDAALGDPAGRAGLHPVGRRVSLDLVGVKEIAERAGVTRDAVHKWRERHPRSFPAPVAELSQGPVWDWRKVAEWLAQTGRGRKKSEPSGDMNPQSKEP